jgi:C-5 cytosine-specific DNA methylase
MARVTLPSLAGLPRPIALDLFCGAGGVGTGLKQAGFKTVIGVDIEPRPTYARLKGMHFVQGDVRALTPAQLRGFDLVWASPPCQAHCGIIPKAQREAHQERWQKEGRHLNLIPSTRKLLVASGRPYIIENVMGARRELRSPIMLCGTMDVFKEDELRVFRRRLFESNLPLKQPQRVCPTQGYSLGALAPKHSVPLPKTEKLRAGARWTLPSGFEQREVHYPSREGTGQIDFVFVPHTPTRIKQVRDMFNRGYARSLVEALRACGHLVPMTKAEIAADKKRYKDELANLVKPSGASTGTAVQIWPVWGLSKTRGSTEEWAEAMGGLHWMSRREVKESIPPAYARYLGKQIIALTKKKL